MRRLLCGGVLLLATACGSKDDNVDDEFVDVDGASSVDDGASDDNATDGDATDGAATDGAATDEGATDEGAVDEGTTDDGDADGAAEDTGPTDTGEAEIPDFDVDGIYEGTFTISLDVTLIDGADPLEDDCTGEVVFIVDEMAETSITGTGSCSFSDDGALAGFVDLGLVDSVGPFEGVTTGEVLTRPAAAGTIAIDTSIGEISTEWEGVFAEASDDVAASLNGSLDGSLSVDLSEVMTGFGEVDVAYEGSFESVRTGDVPVDEDTGSAPDTGLDEPTEGTETGDSGPEDTAGGETSDDGTTAGGGSGTPTDPDGGTGSTGTEDAGSEDTASGSDEGGSTGDTPPVDPTGGPTPE